MGRMTDQPESTMEKTVISGGGRVEHEIFVWESSLVVVIEAKGHLGPIMRLEHQNAVAQVMAELNCTPFTLSLAFSF